MNSTVWLFWRLCWDLNRWDHMSDGHGTWVRLFARLYFLRHRRTNHPLGQPTLYLQVYHMAVNKAASHDEAVDAGLTAVEFYGKHRALSQHQLDDYYDQVKEILNEPAVY